MDSVAYFDNIKCAIDGGQIVTYKWLSDTLSLPTNETKKLLFEYVEKFPQDIQTIYCVCGSLEDFSKRITLTSQSKLEKTKASMACVTSIHIYSVQKSIPKDPSIISAAECQLKTAGYQSLCKNPQLIIEKSKLSSISQDSIKIRESKPKPTEPKVEPKSTVITKREQKKTSVKKQKPTNATKQQAIKKNSTLSKPVTKSNSLLDKLASKPTENSLLGKRSTTSRPSLDKEDQAEKKKAVPSFFSPMGESKGLTKLDVSPTKKRRLTRASSQEGKAEEDSILWNSDEDMASPVSPLTFSDSDEEQESQEDSVPPKISPKRSSPFDKFKKATKPTESTTARKTTTKCESTDKGYLVFSDEVVETNLPKGKTETVKRKSLLKKTNDAVESKKEAKAPAKANQKSLFSFFGGR